MHESSRKKGKKNPDPEDRKARKEEEEQSRSKNTKNIIVKHKNTKHKAGGLPLRSSTLHTTPIEKIAASLIVSYHYSHTKTTLSPSRSPLFQFSSSPISWSKTRLEEAPQKRIKYC